MEFKNLHTETECHCLDAKTIENTSDSFVHKLHKNALNLEKDFRSYWESGKLGRMNPEKCDSVCDHKSVSISLWHKVNEDEETNKILQKSVIDCFVTTFAFSPSPKNRKYMLVFKFEKDAGFCQHSPSNKNFYHYSLYKSDVFSVDKIVQIEIKLIEK